MANVSITLVVPSANGAGSAVDCSAMGERKSIVVEGSLVGVVAIDVSVDGGSTWAEAASIVGEGRRTIRAVANRIRARTSGYQRGAATCTVGGVEEATDFVDLAVPAADGVGASVDVSEYGTHWTAIMATSGTWSGALVLEVSQNNTDWDQALPTFTRPGSQNGEVLAHYVRVRRTGYDAYAPGPATLTLGISTDTPTMVPVAHGIADDTVHTAGELADLLELVPGIATTASAQAFTGHQRTVPVALTDAATIALDAALGNVFTVTTAGNRTMGNPTNVVAGMMFTVIVTQDGVGGRTLAFAANWTFGAEGAPNFAGEVADAVAVISAIAISATKIAATVLRGF